MRRDGLGLWNQADEFARGLPGYAWCFGANRPLYGGRLRQHDAHAVPLMRWKNHDITQAGMSSGGACRRTLDVGAAHACDVFNVHLGTGLRERRYAGPRADGRGILAHPETGGAARGDGGLQRVDTGADDPADARLFQSFGTTACMALSGGRSRACCRC